MWSFWFFCTVWDKQIWLRAKGSHWRHKFVSLASPFPTGYQTFLERQVDSWAFKPVVVSAGWHMVHLCCLLQAISYTPHLDTSPACMEVIWVFPRRGRGRREDHQLQHIKPGATQQKMQPVFCVSVVASARLLLYTAMQQHNVMLKH